MLVKIAIVIISIGLLASLGWFLKSDWFWFAWDIVGAVLVASGCIAEWILLYNEAPEHSDRNKLPEKAWALVVAAGVTMDVFGLIYGIPEAIRLGQNVAGTQMTNSWLVASNVSAARQIEGLRSNNLSMQKELLALTEKTKARNVNSETRKDLIEKVRSLPKGKVEIIMFDGDGESVAFGINLKSALDNAGFETVFSPRTIFRAFEMFPERATAKIDIAFCVKDSKSPPQSAVATVLSFRQGGIMADGWPYNDSLGTNDFQIWVLPRPARE
jgi:hypothetical protein